MWITKAIIFSLFIGFIFAFFFSVLTTYEKVNPDKQNKKRGKKAKKIFFIILITIWAICIVLDLTGFRFDYEAGQHSIVPTAIDSDFWGNYKVYYKTTFTERNSSESFYYIEKNRTDLVQTIEECIKAKTYIIVYYDKWIGFKGLTSPTSSPIIKIDYFN